MSVQELQPSSLPQFAFNQPTEALPFALGPVAMTLPQQLAGQPVGPRVTDLGLLTGALGNYADAANAGGKPELPPLPVVNPLPADFMGPPSRDDLIKAEKEKLQQGMEIVRKLPEAQRDAYLAELLKDTAKFSAGLHGKGDAVDEKTGLAPRYAVPPELISTVRPLINNIERPGEGRVAGGDAEAARDGTGIDWNSQLGVPQYRTQSDNLASPEATCNMTTLAMALERVGYNRADALRAVERKLKREALKKEHAGESVCVIDRDEDIDKMKLPAGAFDKAVEGYLRNQMNPATNAAKYQRLRGEDHMTEAEVKRVASEYKDNAQFEDMLDLLRHVTNSGSRTSMSSGVPEALLAAIEPDPIKRPSLETLQPGGKMDWDAARTKMKGAMDDGGAAFVSFKHKGKGTGDASHIISAQDVQKDGVTFDDPYGHINPTYSYKKTGDAFGPTGSTSRSSVFKNQVAGNKDPFDGLIGNDWKLGNSQNLQAGENLGDTSYSPNSVHQDSWKYARIIRPKTPEQIAAAEAEAYTQIGPLKIPNKGLPMPKEEKKAAVPTPTETKRS